MRRGLVVVALPAVIVTIAVGPVLLWWSTLPTEIAVHWNLSGRADGHASRADGLFLPMALAVVAALVVALAARRACRRTDGFTPVAPLAAAAAFFGALFAGAALTTTWANRDQTRWEDADLPLVAAGAVLLGAAAAAAVVVAVLRPSWARRPTPRAGAVAADGERVAWVGSARSRWMPVWGVVLSAVTAIVAGAASGAIVLPLVLAALGFVLMLGLSSVRVVVGAHGVRVTPGIGWTHVTIQLASIDRVEAIDVNPLRWGGWGYRGGLRLFGRAAWVVRGGEGLRLDLTDGRVFVVTVDDASEAAAVLGEWLARRTLPAPSSS